ncbi:ArsR/SmtB family transcription factor [Peredibacter sp. HCB2-198]|uniref:ArsR/SmtB family transcription factor n=1 Tax=Peredibacter sp. HCB2-198 TaxID=3383025 RepID=UPI0038B66406
MTKKIEAVSIDQVLKALGDPVRLSVIKQLLDAGEEMACGTFEHNLTKATFSHHIKILLDAGVIKRREDGTRKFLSINETLNKLYPGLLDLIQDS